MPRASKKDPDIEATNRLVLEDTINKALIIPRNTLRYEAQKIQVLIRRLDRLSVKNPGSISVASYLELLRRFSEICKELEDNDKSRMDTHRGHQAASDMGEATPDGELAGVSANNPFAG